MRITILVAFTTFILASCTTGKNTYNETKSNRPNFLILVADDVSFDSFGFTGGGVAPDVTPNIDRLASEGLSFEKAFSTVAVCQPSRQSMLTGLIPNHYGSQGFFPMASGTPNLPALLKASGYMTGIIHKHHHLQPEEDFNWDFTNEELGLKVPDGMIGRTPDLLASGLKNLITNAEKENKPFFMFLGSADAHRPFHSDPPNKDIDFWGNGKFDIWYPDPSRIYEPDEITITPALPDIPEIRKDLANYASSVRRLDDAVGACIEVLEETGTSSSTIVMFVSDNGMPLAFGKFDAYLGSNHSPFLIRWPEKIKKGTKVENHLISLMDITPTILDIAGLPTPSPMDGRSLVPFLDGKAPDAWRESIVFIRNQDINYGDALATALKGNPNFTKELEAIDWVPSPEHEVEGTYVRDKEIRTFFDGKYGYIYNHCYQENAFEKGPMGTIVPYNGRSIRALKNAGKNDPKIKARYEFYMLRAREELYDWSTDPGSLINLAEDPAYAEVLNTAREGLHAYMESAKDPVKEDFRKLIQQ